MVCPALWCFQTMGVNIRQETHTNPYLSLVGEEASSCIHPVYSPKPQEAFPGTWFLRAGHRWGSHSSRWAGAWSDVGPGQMWSEAAPVCRGSWPRGRAAGSPLLPLLAAGPAGWRMHLSGSGRVNGQSGLSPASGTALGALLQHPPRLAVMSR